MRIGKDYLREIQKFTTSQYWNSGVRITTGVLVPMLIMIQKGWLSDGIPFLWGALFVSLTDTPGPIHHRRNGMLAAIALYTITVVITGLVYAHPVWLLAEVLLCSFFFSMLGIYGARAGAVGTLALVVMLLNMSPFREHSNFILDAMLTAAGGIWYGLFSLTLVRLQPYRLVEQALGESLFQIAEYIRARGEFYKTGSDFDTTFNLVMQEQVDVLKTQNQLRELIFKTRQFVSDPSPKSRSIMMVFLESLDLFEETMHTYQDYKLLQQHTRHTGLLEKFYVVILKIENELERIGLSVQAGIPVKRMPDLTEELNDLSLSLQEQKRNSFGDAVAQSLLALELTIENIRNMVDRLCKIALYTQMKIDINPTLPDNSEVTLSTAPSKPLHASLLFENFTLRSNNFRYAVRLTLAIVIGSGASMIFEVSHTYWVLLTIVTILKPVYNVTRRRNIQRVAGTLCGVILASVVLFFVSNGMVLLILLIGSMLMAYSFLRINYFGFVTFLTTYIIITFHFLNPSEFRNLIGERLIDTFIGSIIAALAARFIFPVWEHENIKKDMLEVIDTNRQYLRITYQQFTQAGTDDNGYNTARSAAVVALTNLSDHFQQMLSEPKRGKQTSHVHQFVIASHALTSRISALSPNDLKNLPPDVLQTGMEKIDHTLTESIDNLSAETETNRSAGDSLPFHAATSMSIIYSLSRDLRNITLKMAMAMD